MLPLAPFKSDDFGLLSTSPSILLLSSCPDLLFQLTPTPFSIPRLPVSPHNRLEKEFGRSQSHSENVANTYPTEALWHRCDLSLAKRAPLERNNNNIITVNTSSS